MYVVVHHGGYHMESTQFFRLVFFGGIFAFLFGLVSPLAFAETDADLNSELHRYDVAHARIEYFGTLKELEMDVVISYLSNLSVNVSALETIRAEYDTLLTQVLSYETTVGIHEGTAQLQEKVQEFRETAGPLVESYGNKSELKELIQDTVKVEQEEGGELYILKEEWKTTARTYSSVLFTVHIDQLSSIVANLSAQGINTSTLEPLVTEMESYEALIQEAAAAGDREQLRDYSKELRSLHREFAQEMRSIMKELEPEERKALVSAAVFVQMDTQVASMQATLLELETLGYDTTNLSVYVTSAEEHATEAEVAYEAGNSTLARAEIEAYHQSIQSYRKELHDLGITVKGKTGMIGRALGLGKNEK